jgi:hypothetical protein
MRGCKCNGLPYIGVLSFSYFHRMNVSENGITIEFAVNVYVEII